MSKVKKKSIVNNHSSTTVKINYYYFVNSFLDNWYLYLLKRLFNFIRNNDYIYIYLYNYYISENFSYLSIILEKDNLNLSPIDKFYSSILSFYYYNNLIYYYLKIFSSFNNEEKDFIKTKFLSKYLNFSFNINSSIIDNFVHSNPFVENSNSILELRYTFVEYIIRTINDWELDRFYNNVFKYKNYFSNNIWYLDKIGFYHLDFSLRNIFRNNDKFFLWDYSDSIKIDFKINYLIESFLNYFELLIYLQGDIDNDNFSYNKFLTEKNIFFDKLEIFLSGLFNLNYNNKYIGFSIILNIFIKLNYLIEKKYWTNEFNYRLLLYKIFLSDLYNFFIKKCML